MRIGLATGEYPPMQGGVGDFTYELGRALVAVGHQVHVITGEPQTAQGQAQDLPLQGVGGQAQDLPLHGDWQDSGMVVHRTVTGWRWGCWRQMLALAQELRLEFLNVQYQAAAYSMHPAIHFVPRREGRLPVVITFHDLKVPYLFPKAGPLRWQAVRMLARRADGVIVTNQGDYLRMEGDISSKRLSLIPIGSNIPPVPPPGYDRDAERASWDVGPDDLLMGYFGFLNESKGGEELVQTLAILVDAGVPAHLLMVGGRVGSSDVTNRAYAQQVEGLIAELGLEGRVHWTGYTHPEAVSAGLLATDVSVLPYRDGVSFRRGTLHACLAHGRPLVTTWPVVPLPEVVDGENMLLVAPRDPERLAQAVTRLAGDPALRARLAAGAKALAAEFTWERIARQTAAFFGRI
jgi:glycosyltransferase involved in cell wall biosynthesis